MKLRSHSTWLNPFFFVSYDIEIIFKESNKERNWNYKKKKLTDKNKGERSGP